jgi:hypothetical protein
MGKINWWVLIFSIIGFSTFLLMQFNDKILQTIGMSIFIFAVLWCPVIVIMVYADYKSEKSINSLELYLPFLFFMAACIFHPEFLGKKGETSYYLFSSGILLFVRQIFMIWRNPSWPKD